MLQERHLRFAVALVVVPIAVGTRIPAQDAVSLRAEVGIGIEIVRGSETPERAPGPWVPYAECVPVPGSGAVVVVRLTVVASTGGGVAAGGVAEAVAVVRSCCSSTRISSSSVLRSSLEAFLNSLMLRPERPAEFRELARAKDNERNHQDDDELGHADGAKHR